MPVRDVSPRPVLLAGGSIVAAVVGVVVVVVGQLAWWDVPLDGARTAAPPAWPARAALEPAAQPERAAAEARAAAALHTTAWIDATHGLARVPIETAMRLMAERGLRAAPAAASGPTDVRGPRAAVAPPDAASGATR